MKNNKTIAKIQGPRGSQPAPRRTTPPATKIENFKFTILTKFFKIIL